MFIKIINSLWILVPAHDEVQEEVGGHGVHSWKTTSVELGLLTSFVGNHLQVELQGLLEKYKKQSSNIPTTLSLSQFSPVRQ